MSKCEHSNHGYICWEPAYLKQIAALETRCREQAIELGDANCAVFRISGELDVAVRELAVRNAYIARLESMVPKESGSLGSALETPADPPTWEDLRGAAPDATGSLSSEAFVRQLRNEWDKETPLERTVTLAELQSDGGKGSEIIDKAVYDYVKETAVKQAPISRPDPCAHPIDARGGVDRDYCLLCGATVPNRSVK